MATIHETRGALVIYEVNGEWLSYIRSRRTRSGCYWLEGNDGQVTAVVVDDFGTLVPRY